MNTRASMVVVSGVLLVLATGCPPGPHVPSEVTDDMPMRVVIARINENSRKLDFLLKGSGVSAQVKYVEEAQRKSLSLNGTMLYRKPRKLWLRLEHTWGEGLEIGSNEQQFWVWQRGQSPRYWWGEHGRVSDLTDTRMPIRPDHLLEVLGLEDLPPKQSLLSGPFIRVHPDRYELVFLDTAGSATEEPQRYISRALFVDRREPFLVREIVRYTPDGHLLMRAELSRYEPIETSQVLVPRRIEVDWPAREGRAVLEFLALTRFDKPAAERYFVSPLEREEEGLGSIERVDLPEPPAVPQLPAGVTQPADVADP